MKAVRSFLGQRVYHDPRLVTECASILKLYRDTESDFVLDKPTAAKILGSPMNRHLRVILYTLASSGARAKFFSLEGCRFRSKSGISSFEGRDNKDKSWPDSILN